MVEQQVLITGAQIRMARGLLRWSVKELADKSGIGSTTIKRLEKDNNLSTDVQISHNHAIRDAFLATGQLKFEENACVYIGD